MFDKSYTPPFVILNGIETSTVELVALGRIFISPSGMLMSSAAGFKMVTADQPPKIDTDDSDRVKTN